MLSHVGLRFPVGLSTIPGEAAPACHMALGSASLELLAGPDPSAGRMPMSGKNIKLSHSEVVVGSAPLPGQHTAEILPSLLHYTP